jgi:hypothetical protein
MMFWNLSALPPVNTARGAGFAHNDRRELRQYRFQIPPKPSGKILAGWILQTGNFIEIIMIKSLKYGTCATGDIRKIYYPAVFRINCAGDMYFYTK